ncbi:Na+/H+ antiporter subunit D, partial [cyanobacterium TDX16]
FILIIAGITMVVGVLGAIAQTDMKRILSFHIVSQIGYMVLGLGLFTVAGIGAAILFVVNQVVLKSTLLLTAGMVDHGAGSSRINDVGGLARRFPLVGWLFLLPALSLAGIPPFSGFVAKLSVVEAGFGGDEWLVVGVALAVSVLTLYSMTKIWGGVFWGEVQVVAVPEDRSTERFGGTVPMLAATGALVVGSVALAVLSGPLFDLCQRAADDLLHPAAYVEEVLP